MTLQELNNTFGLTVEITESVKNTAGYYTKNVIYISNDLERFIGIQPSRPNSFGSYLFPNVMSLIKGDLRSTCIAHEFGHAIEDSFRDDSYFRDLRSTCDRLAPRYISVYSGNRHPLSTYSEAFAEVFALYICNPNELHNLSNELFEEMNDFYVSFL